MLLVLTGKSGSGKDTVAKELARKHGFNRIVTTTSRPMRKGEKQDIDYHFITKEEFLKKIDDNHFIEYRSYNTSSGEWYYGTSYGALENIRDDKNYIIIVTPDAIKKIHVPHKSIYLYANNSTLIKRLNNRKDKNDSIQRRLENDNKDFKGIENEVDRIVYNNDGVELDDVVDKILECLEN